MAWCTSGVDASTMSFCSGRRARHAVPIQPDVDRLPPSPSASWRRSAALSEPPRHRPPAPRRTVLASGSSTVQNTSSRAFQCATFERRFGYNRSVEASPLADAQRLLCEAVDALARVAGPDLAPPRDDRAHRYSVSILEAQHAHPQQRVVMQGAALSPHGLPRHVTRVLLHEPLSRRQHDLRRSAGRRAGAGQREAERGAEHRHDDHRQARGSHDSQRWPRGHRSVGSVMLRSVDEHR